VAGKLIQRRFLTDTNISEVEIDASVLSPGIFIVNLMQDELKHTFKLIKQ